MGVSLTERNRVQIQGLTFVFPCFTTMRPSIRRVLESYIEVKRGKRINRLKEILDNLFFRKCECIENVPPVPGWKKGIDPEVRHSVVSIFSSQLEVTVKELDTNTQVTVNALVGKIVFYFPPLKDPDFKDAINNLRLTENLPDKIHLKRYLDERIKFFRSYCHKVTGIDDLGSGWKWSIPENWISTAVAHFEGVE